jgi:hypothetical protein
MRLTDTQRRLLDAAAQRDDRLVPLPPGLKGGAVIKVVAKLMDAGLVRETPTEDKAAVWRRDNRTKKELALKLTAAGMKACSPSPEADAVVKTPTTVEAKWKGGHVKGMGAEAVASSEARAPRDGSKISAVISLLQQENGATIDEIVKATGWLPHTTRAALTGLRKRGYTIERRERATGSGSYAIATPKQAVA